MDDLVAELLEGEDAWVRRRRDPRQPARPAGARRRRDLRRARGEPHARYAGGSGGAPFPLSERHGAWRVALDGGRTRRLHRAPGRVDRGRSRRHATSPSTRSRRRSGGGAELDPCGGRADLEARTLRRVADAIFDDDPLRLLRAVRLEDELGLRLDAETEALVRGHGGARCAARGRADPRRARAPLARGLAAPGRARPARELGGSAERLDAADLVESPRVPPRRGARAGLERLPISNELRRYAATLLRAEPPADGSPRAIHRFRRATEPWALDALAFVHARASTSRRRARGAREREPAEPLLRGDELGLPPGPEIGAYARIDGGGARRGHDLDEGGGARACPTPSGSGSARTPRRWRRSRTLARPRRRGAGPAAADAEGDERALDVGTGAGAFALALAPLVREVVGVDLVPELLEQARARAPREHGARRGGRTRAAVPRAARSTSSAARGRSTTRRGPSSSSPR